MKKLFTGIFLSLLGVAVGMAMPAKPGMVKYHMSDGTTLSVSIHGDETSAYYLSADGHVLLSGPRGDLYFAALRNGKLVRSKIKAAIKGNRTLNDIRYIDALDKDQILNVAQNSDKELRSQALSRRRAASTMAASMDMITSYPTVGSPKALILLVQFKDVKFKTQNPLESFKALTNERGYSHNGATGSAYDYFYENSNGLFTPDFQVFGPVTLDNNESYYGETDGQLHDKQAWKIVTEGCSKLRKMNPDLDFSQFDNDGDGFVDNVFVYYAGYGQNEGGESWTIWPHTANVYTFYGADEEYNGVKLGNYACTNELRGTDGTVRTGIGSFCHEFSHVLGLPDIYSTNGSSVFSPGYYEVMDIGSYNNDGNTPPYMSAYDRMSLGWMKVRDLSGPEDITLKSITSNEAVRIKTNRPEEFFVLENRQLTGWDKYIPGHGMLIWHIDYDPVLWGSNKVNCNSQHQNIDLVEADGILTEATRDGDPFPGTGGVSSFTSSSYPAMRTWSGADPGMPVTQIVERDGYVSFKVKGGGKSLDPVTAVEATDITPVSFRANWVGRDDISSYEVDLCCGRHVVPISTVTVNNATSWVFADLDPSTEYHYQVRAVSGERKSVDSNDMSVVTQDAAFDMLTAIALPPMNVYGTEFTAAWQPLENANAYELQVYSKNVIEPDMHKADFSGGIGSVPAQWYTSSKDTDSRSGYFGNAAPSLRFNDNRGQIQSPIFTDDITYLSFWYRGDGTSDSDHIDVDALLNNAWQTISSITPINNTSGVVFSIGGEDSSAKMPEGVKTIRLVYHRNGSSGAVCVDDINVGVGGGFIPVYVEGFNPFNAGTALSVKVDNLTPSTTYYYVVTGVNGELRSLPSEEIKVTTPNSTVLDNEELSESLISITSAPEGVTVINDDSVDHLVECVAPSGVIYFSGWVKAGGIEHIRLPYYSIFIVKCGDVVAKVLL